MTSGVASLFAVSIAASTLAPGLEAREVVVAIQAGAWVLLAGLAGLVAGRAIIGPAQLRGHTLGVALAVSVLAIFVAWAVFAAARGGATHLDVDAVGVAALLPGALVAIATSLACLSRASSSTTSAWRVVVIAVSVGALLITAAALGEPRMALALAGSGAAAIAASAEAWLVDGR